MPPAAVVVDVPVKKCVAWGANDDTDETSPPSFLELPNLNIVVLIVGALAIIAHRFQRFSVSSCCACAGTHGDVYPFLGLAKRLQVRFFGSPR